MTTAYEIYMAGNSGITEREAKAGLSLIDRPAFSQPLDFKQYVVKERFWTYFGHTLVTTIIPPAT